MKNALAFVIIALLSGACAPINQNSGNSEADFWSMQNPPLSKEIKPMGLDNVSNIATQMGFAKSFLNGMGIVTNSLAVGTADADETRRVSSLFNLNCITVRNTPPDEQINDRGSITKVVNYVESKDKSDINYVCPYTGLQSITKTQTTYDIYQDSSELENISFKFDKSFESVKNLTAAGIKLDQPASRFKVVAVELSRTSQFLIQSAWYEKNRNGINQTKSDIKGSYTLATGEKYEFSYQIRSHITTIRISDSQVISQGKTISRLIFDSNQGLMVQDNETSYDSNGKAKNKITINNIVVSEK